MMAQSVTWSSGQNLPNTIRTSVGNNKVETIVNYNFQQTPTTYTSRPDTDDGFDDVREHCSSSDVAAVFNMRGTGEERLSPVAVRSPLHPAGSDNSECRSRHHQRHLRTPARCSSSSSDIQRTTFPTNSNSLNFINYCRESSNYLVCSKEVTADSCHRMTSTSCLRRTALPHKSCRKTSLWNTLIKEFGFGRRRRFRFSSLLLPSFLNMYIRVTTLMLIVSTVLRTTDACSSRSTPKPRAPSNTMRPNITFPTYACPQAYATWYCLNGATCFTVEISESILYNCVCAEGFTGPRCEFKDLDGSYLPSREKVMIEKASIASGVTIAVLLMVIISIAVYIYSRRRKKEKVCDQIDSSTLPYPPRPFTNRSQLTRQYSQHRDSTTKSHDVEAGSNIQEEFSSSVFSHHTTSVQHPSVSFPNASQL